MRFLVDACTGPLTARWLREQQHEVFSVYDEAPGMDDTTIIEKAIREAWILVTNDKDFGEKVYREGHRHHGVILLRLSDERPANKIATLQRLMVQYADQLPDQFVVVTEQRVRFARKPA
jgi:predicted nuclease of predicted toxin-antitoxin system